MYYYVFQLIIVELSGDLIWGKVVVASALWLFLPFLFCQTPASVDGVTVDPVLEAKYKEKFFTQVISFAILLTTWFMSSCLSEEMGDAGYIQNMAIRPLCLHEHNNLVLSSESIKFRFLRHRMIQKMFRTVGLCQSETSSSLCPSV